MAPIDREHRSSGLAPEVRIWYTTKSPLSKLLPEQQLEVVEAGGVEPPSEKCGSLATTCLSLRLISFVDCPESGNRPQTSLLISRAVRRRCAAR
jgi:hypothetical protein